MKGEGTEGKKEYKKESTMRKRRSLLFTTVDSKAKEEELRLRG
jgi:hypothetical protein